MNQACNIAPGLLALHSNRTELLAQTLAHWMHQRPLQPLEEEIVLVQSNGMAEWFKMELARTLGVSTALRVELPGRFIWRMYRQILSQQNIPRQTPLDKPALLWKLMQLLPPLLAQDVTQKPWQPLQRSLYSAQHQAHVKASVFESADLQENAFSLEHAISEGDDTAYFFLARRIADLFDQYQVYRPDWLEAWEQGKDQITAQLGVSPQPIPEDFLWQPQLWRLLLETQSAKQRNAIRPKLHQLALHALTQPTSIGLEAQTLKARLPRRVVLFGMTQIPLPTIELLAAMGEYSQVLLAVPNPCRFYWSDALSGRELFFQMHRRSQNKAPRQKSRKNLDLSKIPLESMHDYANPLLMMWGRQVRDFMRQLQAYDEAQAAQERMGLPRIDLFDIDTENEMSETLVSTHLDKHPADIPTNSTLLQHVQRQVLDLQPIPKNPKPTAAPKPEDRSIAFQITHSPMREVEALHDFLLDSLRPDALGESLQARDIVVMVPEISQYAPLIHATFGQYSRKDTRFLPYNIADMGAQNTSTLLQALNWLTDLPNQRAELSTLSDLLAIPSVASCVGLDEHDVKSLQKWMQNCGIRWGLNAQHRAQLGITTMGDENTAWMGLQRMLLGFASEQSYGLQQPFKDVTVQPELIGALAQLLDRLSFWQQELNQPARPTQWGERWRALLGDFLRISDESDKAALALAEDALQAWMLVVSEADFAAPISLPIARHAWLDNLTQPDTRQRFHTGGITFCTLLPMRAIPFKVVCLLGMNEGVYPRRNVPNELDLMAQPNVLRPGDRSRTQDDRQLMLEALLSARHQLLISWVGRSIRDNIPRPPSVLVAQLQDYLRSIWGDQVITERTTEHPLQPFDESYFQANSNLHTWAHEWRLQQLIKNEPENDAVTPTKNNALDGSKDAVCLDSATLPTTNIAHEATPQSLPISHVWSIQQLQQFWTKPVNTWFIEHLQVKFEDLPKPLDDREPIQIKGLVNWQIQNQLLQTVQPAIKPDRSLEDINQIIWQELEKMQLAGHLPFGEIGHAWAKECMHDLQFLLNQWRESLQKYHIPAPHLHLQITHRQKSALKLDDWVEDLRHFDLNTELHLIQVTPSKLLVKNNKKKRLRLDKLVHAWLLSLAFACQKHRAAPLNITIIGKDCELKIRPMHDDAIAHQKLEQIMELAAQYRHKILPFAWQTALAWLEKKDSQEALQEAQAAYDKEVELNPYLARLWPDFKQFYQASEFEKNAQTMLQDIINWEDSVEVVLAEDDDKE